MVCQAILLIVAAIPVTGNCEFSKEDATGHVPHWGYGGHVGRSHWVGMAAEFALCGSGKRQ